MEGDGWLNRIALYFSQYEKGFYPEKGGINDQPAKFAELMVTYEAVREQVNEAARKQAAQKPPPPKNQRVQRTRG